MGALCIAYQLVKWMMCAEDVHFWQNLYFGVFHHAYTIRSTSAEHGFILKPSPPLTAIKMYHLVTVAATDFWWAQIIQNGHVIQWGISLVPRFQL